MRFPSTKQIGTAPLLALSAFGVLFAVCMRQAAGMVDAHSYLLCVVVACAGLAVLAVLFAVGVLAKRLYELSRSFDSYYGIDPSHWVHSDGPESQSRRTD